MNRFVLLSGTMRSGTSLLGELLYSRSKGLAMHPDLSFANDNFDTLRQWLRAAAESAEPQSPVRRITGPLHASSKQLTEALRQVVGDEVDPPVAEFLVEGIRALAPTAQPARLVGVKATGLMAEFDLLRQAFPEARFLVSIRDPRDVLASSLRRCGYAQRFDGWRILADIANLHLFLRERHDDPAIRQVRYEDMVHEPEAQMHGILEFLGLDAKQYRWDLLSGQDIGSNSSYLDHRGKGWQKGGGIRSDSIGRFADVLSAEQVNLVEMLLAPMMESLGYMPTGRIQPPPNPAALARFLPALVRRCRVRGVCEEGLRQIGTVPDYPGLDAEVQRRAEMADLLVSGRQGYWTEFRRVLRATPVWPSGARSGRRDLRAIRAAAKAGRWELVEDRTLDMVAGEQSPGRIVRMVLAVLAGLTNWKRQVAYIDWKLAAGEGFDPFLSLKRLNLVIHNARRSRLGPDIDAFWQGFEAYREAHGTSEQLKRTGDNARKLLDEAGLG